MAAPLDHSASDYSHTHAYWLAEASRAAYKSPAEAEGLARDWGFGRFRHFSSPHTMPFPIDDTQAYVAASDRMIVVAFRGTEPTNLRDWLSDADTPPRTRPGGATGKLHDRMPALGLLADKVKGATADPFAPASDGIRDHFIDAYVNLLAKNAG